MAVQGVEPAAAPAADPAAEATSPPPAPRFGEALRYWLRLGFISFGGPAGQIALMHEELVERRRWISDQRFLHALNYCMLLPGPEAQQLATYVGWLLHRTAGGLAAGMLFVLPSLAILIGLSGVYLAYGELPAVAGVFYGIKPAVTALVLHAAWRIGGRTLRNPLLWALAVASFVAIFVFALPFPLIVLSAGLVGWLGGRLWPQRFAPGGGHGPATAAGPPAVIGDGGPPLPHTRFSLRRFVQLLLAALVLWSLCLGALALWLGPQAVLTQMGWFFTKAALLTFGGAYAVLPYVVQGAVEQHHWLQAPQMIDGLALGETTPGPLIMVVAFVGFVGGWTHQILGPEALWAAGIVAACVVTFFTFLPSFAFVLLGAPFIESTHGKLGFTAPLTAITAAVVGVIANLALFFAVHVLWPAGLQGRFEWPAAAIGVAAGLALYRGRLGVIPVVLGAGLAGLAWRLAAGA